MASSSSTDIPTAPSDLEDNVRGWVDPHEVNTPAQYLGRKTLPIKRGDAEPLTREDIQYDLLYFIFADSTRAFVDHMAPGRPLVNFCDLYVNALYNSSKCSKVLKEKMLETPQFAIEFAKIALLTNVGRINTTMAFFPEMKTALRSYHPVPALQKSGGNLQDAPRIKNCLKAALLPFEFRVQPPSTPAEILEKARKGQVPPTSVVNLIFVLANSAHALAIAEAHFDPPLEFLDLFLPVNLSSVSRARVFLWIMFHYLSAPDAPNPFADDFARENPGQAPRMMPLTREETQRENQDPPEEIAWGRRMSAIRSGLLRELVEEMEAEKKRKKHPSVPQMVPSALLPAQDNPAVRRSRAHRAPPLTSEGSRGSSHGLDFPVFAVPIQQPTPRFPRAPQILDSAGDGQHQERSMVEHAWHAISSNDPLEDSDVEADEHVRLDYSRRLRVLSRLRGKDPTPPPLHQQLPPQGEPSNLQPQQMVQFLHQYQHDTGDFEGESPTHTGTLRQVEW